MKYLVTVLLFVLFIADRIIKNKLTSKSDAFKGKKIEFIKEKTGDKDIDILIKMNNLVYIGGVALLIGVIVFNAIKWFSL